MFTFRAWSFSAFLCLFVACNDGKRYHETATAEPVPQTLPTRGLEAIKHFQEELNAEFLDPDVSPLTEAERSQFKGLDYFPPDTTYQVEARLVRTPQALPFDMPTTTTRMSRERQYGTLYFELDGASYQLKVYQNLELMEQTGYEDYLFLPFTDNTNGTDSYTGGRYIDLRIPGGDQLLLDFNRAYNPYCAYNAKFSCPIVPRENHLDLEVRAGVMKYGP